jgi:hypothetical protein
MLAFANVVVYNYQYMLDPKVAADSSLAESEFQSSWQPLHI